MYKHDVICTPSGVPSYSLEKKQGSGHMNGILPLLQGSQVVTLTKALEPVLIVILTEVGKLLDVE